MYHSDERQRQVVELTNYGQRSWDGELRPASALHPSSMHVGGWFWAGHYARRWTQTGSGGTGFFFLRQQVEASREVCVTSNSFSAN